MVTLAVAEPDRIPIHNLWFLLVYAWDLAAFAPNLKVKVEESPDLPHLVVGLFAAVVERRLRRSPTRHYVGRAATLPRVRGRIDVFRIVVERTLERGEVACRFEELSIDTPRNRFVRAALAVAGRMRVEAGLAHRCRNLAQRLELAGVAVVPASVHSLARETFGRNDAEDRPMVELARLVLELALPTEEAGTRGLPAPIRDEVLLRRLFERAVGGFYAYHLPKAQGWTVDAGQWLDWPQVGATDGIADLLPRMQTDIVIEAPGRRLVIDTKFTDILTRNRFGRERFKSGYLYQMYAYLGSQAHLGSMHATAEGLLLHPSLGLHVNEFVTIQNHLIRFATLDLMAETAEIERRLLDLAGARTVGKRAA